MKRRWFYLESKEGKRTGPFATVELVKCKECGQEKEEYVYERERLDR